MALHKDLTGAELHEPKGIETATLGQIYVANGSGSGVWTSRNDDNHIFNSYFLQDQMTDISNTSDNVYFFVPVESDMVRLAAILHGPITAANAILSIYVNGVLFADSLTVTFTGSSAGQLHQLVISTPHTIAAGSVIEVRTDGGSTTTAKATISLELLATG